MLGCGLDHQFKQSFHRRTMSLKILTASQLRQHATKDDLYIVIDDGVYDVTKWQSEHPGGGAVLLDQGGRDVTELFEAADHSADARQLKEKFRIGRLEDETLRKRVQESAVAQEAITQTHHWEHSTFGFVFTLGLVLMLFGALQWFGVIGT